MRKNQEEEKKERVKILSGGVRGAETITETFIAYIIETLSNTLENKFIKITTLRNYCNQVR